MYMYNWEVNLLSYLKCVPCHHETLVKGHHGPLRSLGNASLPTKTFGYTLILTVNVSRKFAAGYSTFNSFNRIQKSGWSFYKFILKIIQKKFCY